MQVACAWCGKLIRVIDGQGVEGTSHGICLECAEIEWQKYQEFYKSASGEDRTMKRKVKYLFLLLSIISPIILTGCMPNINPGSFDLGKFFGNPIVTVIVLFIIIYWWLKSGHKK